MNPIEIDSYENHIYTMKLSFPDKSQDSGVESCDLRLALSNLTIQEICIPAVAMI